jgi:protocatechuate 3,4-dioxygenase beta subunit
VTDTADVVDPALATMLARCVACRPWAEQDEGPYHRRDAPMRRDIVEDRAGLALQLGIRLGRHDGTPPAAAELDIWHCDALGRYSGFPPPRDSAVVTTASAPRAQYLPDDTFLRGRQPTDPAGLVEFRTIYPGWYPGRTVHIHLIVRVDGAELTSQLYFPEPVTAVVSGRVPYAERPGRDTFNDTDTIYPTGGDPAVVEVEPAHAGYRAAISLTLPGAR